MIEKKFLLLKLSAENLIAKALFSQILTVFTLD